MNETKKDSRLFIYKMITDNGGAPCVYKDLLSLAICKPLIRSSAGTGDWIIGIGGRSTIGERLIYVSRVSEVLCDGAYYKEEEFFTRPDCIYRWDSSSEKYYWKNRKMYHKNGEMLNHDLGKEGREYKNTKVLLSSEFRYYGKEGNEDYKKVYPNIKALIEDLTQGHRVNHPEKLRKEAENLILKCMAKERKDGMPTEDDLSKRCNSGCDDSCHSL